MVFISFPVPIVCGLKRSRKSGTLKPTWRFVDRSFEIEELPLPAAPVAASWEMDDFRYHVRHHRQTGDYFQRMMNQPARLDAIEMSEVWDDRGFDIWGCLHEQLELVAEAEGAGEVPIDPDGIEWPKISDGMTELQANDIAANLLEAQLEIIAEHLDRYCLIGGEFYMVVSEPVVVIHEDARTPYPTCPLEQWPPLNSALMAFSLAHWERAVRCVEKLGIQRSLYDEHINVLEIHRDEFNPIDPRIPKVHLLNAFVALYLTDHSGGPWHFFKVDGFPARDRRWLAEFKECIEQEWDELPIERLDKAVNALLTLQISPRLRTFAETSRAFGVVRQAFLEEMATSAARPEIMWDGGTGVAPMPRGVTIH